MYSMKLRLMLMLVTFCILLLVGLKDRSSTVRAWVADSYSYR